MSSTTSRKIAFEAQDNGVLSTFDRIKQSAEELSRELIAEARIQANSGKDQLRYIEDQIKAIERRNKLDKERGVLSAVETRDAAAKGGSEDASQKYKEQVAELNKIAKEDTLQTNLLRDILQAQRDAILAEAEADFQQGAGRDVLPPLPPDSMSDNEGETDKEKRGKQKGADDIEKDVDQVTTAAVTNPIQAAVQSLPFIGGALAVMTALGSELDDAQGRYRATTGYGGTRDANMAMYGMTTTEFLNQEAQILRSQGEHHGRGTRELIQQGVSFGIDSGTLAQYASTERSQIDTKTTAQSLDEMLAIFHKSNLFEIGPQSFINIEEKIRFQTQLNEMQASQMDLIKNDTAIRVQEAFGRVGGAFGDQRALSTISSVNNALANPDNEYKQAFLYNSLQQIKPGSSLFELQEMQEKGVFGEGFMQQVMTDLTEQMGGREAVMGNAQLKDMLMMNVRDMLGLNSSQSRRLTDSFLSGGTDFSRIGIDINSAQEGLGQYQLNPGTPIGEASQVLATIKEEVAKPGDKGIDFFADIFKTITEGVDQKGFGGFVGDIFGNAASAVGDAFQSMIDNIAEYFQRKFDEIITAIMSTIDSLNPFSSNSDKADVSYLNGYAGN